MGRVIFDIETVGQDFELLDDASKEYFLKFADTPEKAEEAKNSLSFYPLTAQVVAIGMLEVESSRGAVYFQNNNGSPEKFTEDGIVYMSGSEKDILSQFWKKLAQFDKFITFNGRLFDCPFVMIRSAVNGIRSSRNIMPYRYSHDQHVDLADQLSFYDAMRRKFSLHMWCRAFGIASPKEEGMTGLQVKDYYHNGRYQDIARYCFRDIRSTKELFLYWDKYLRF